MSPAGSTDRELWGAVDRFLGDLLLPPDPALQAALARSEAAGLPAIQVTPAQGMLLHLLARASGARAILEVGTLGGYSAIWLARALPEGGRLVTLEADARHAEVARANLAHAGLGDRVDIRLGPAIESLAQLEAEGSGPFDLIFLDADKQGLPEYLGWSLRLARRGALIVADNVVREGAVADEAVTDASNLGVRRFLALLGAEPRVTATAVQMVGAKGYDGMAIALVSAGA